MILLFSGVHCNVNNNYGGWCASLKFFPLGEGVVSFVISNADHVGNVSRH